VGHLRDSFASRPQPCQIFFFDSSAEKVPIAGSDGYLRPGDEDILLSNYISNFYLLLLYALIPFFKA
jgi:hypothetical protein